VGLATRYPGMHAWRSLIGVVSIGAWFYAIAHLPLATAMTLNYMSSVWIAAFLVGGALMTWWPSSREPRPPLQVPLVLAVLAGFGGVVMMLRPSISESQGFAALIGLCSGLTAALAYMQVASPRRAPCTTSPPARPWPAAPPWRSPACRPGPAGPRCGCCRWGCWPRWGSCA
jgi:drug/metabolite transporter (DMT)-like permease